VFRLLKKVAVDTTAIRESRDFRRLAIGQVLSNLGTQAAMVALPYQVYVITHSATLVGLIGLFELGPMVFVALVGGAVADRVDRRPVLAAAQVGVMVVTAALFLVSWLADPGVIVILLLAGLLAGFTALNGVASGAIVPGMLGPDLMRSGLAFSYGMNQAAGIVGPGVGGLLIGVTGVKGIYLFDAISCLGILWAALSIPPQPPHGVVDHPPVRAAIAEGLKFVVSNRALAGSFLIDINAMMFGMPRALFAVLSLSVYHAGASGTGLLYAAIAVGGTLSVLSSGWILHVNRLGRVCICAVVFWGLTIGSAGLVRSIWPAAVLLTAAGWADGISAVCRNTISQSVTPDRLRGRMGAVFSLVVTSGPRLGDMESGFVAGLAGALNSVLIGGVGCLVGVALTAAIYPELDAYEADKAIELLRADNAAHPQASGFAAENLGATADT
jgi:MFS family permease